MFLLITQVVLGLLGLALLFFLGLCIDSAIDAWFVRRGYRSTRRFH